MYRCRGKFRDDPSFALRKFGKYASSLHKCSICHPLWNPSTIAVCQGRAMIVFKRSLWTACIILSALITLSIFIYINDVSWKAEDQLGVKFAPSHDPMWTHTLTRVLNKTFSTTSITNTTTSATASTECSNNYILSVWDQTDGALGNKMSDYASLIGHARRLQLRPFIMPSMREALSKIFRSVVPYCLFAGGDHSVHGKYC